MELSDCVYLRIVEFGADLAVFGDLCLFYICEGFDLKHFVLCD